MGELNPAVLENGFHPYLTENPHMECGTCRIICDDCRNVDWECPRGGYGVLFKFG